MGYAEQRGDYWRARYKIAPGKYGTAVDGDGYTVRFKSKRAAEKAADDAEAEVRNGRRRPIANGRMKFGDYASVWYSAQDLAASTMQNYRRHLEEHVLPAFGDWEIGRITPADINAWVKREREVPYADSSVKTWRATLHLVLADAVEEGLIDSNPAVRRRGRGRRVGRSRGRGAEKTITTALGILLIAERVALLSGRDDEFVAVVYMGFTGSRWGETVGLETKYVRSDEVRIEWQLYELDTGELHRCAPKDDSRRSVAVPGWLSKLLLDQIAESSPGRCECHGLNYVFSGHRSANGAAGSPGSRLVDVARRAGVSTGTVSAVLNERASVAEQTRVKVEAAIADLGYVRGAWSGVRAPHWRRTGFATWLFQPAATGWYPRKAPQESHPVPVLADPWPGVPVRGRNAAGRADACWIPVATGLTPHGLRHSYKTLMLELGTPAHLMDAQMGHQDGSIQARYSHVTPEMVRRLTAGLTEVWNAALDARRSMNPGSPVAMLDRLLKAGESGETPQQFSPRILPR